MSIDIDDFPYDFKFNDSTLFPGFPVEDIYTYTYTESRPTIETILKNLQIKDCGGKGDCQFLSIEKALEMDDLREKLSYYIEHDMTDDEFDMFINFYRLEKEKGEFVGKWDPYTINNKIAFSKEIKKQGYNFQGDNITLLLLSRILNKDFYIVQESSIIMISGVNLPYTKNNDFIILKYTKGPVGHYQLIGTKDNVFNFNRQNIPKSIKDLLNLCTSCQNFEEENTEFKIHDTELKSPTIQSIKMPTKQPHFDENITLENFKNKPCEEGYGGWKIEQLKELCTILKISKRGSKKELCTRINEYMSNKKIKIRTKSPQFEEFITEETFKDKPCEDGYGGWKTQQLITFCKILNISTRGSKKELCSRIQKHLKSNTQSKSRSHSPIKEITPKEIKNNDYCVGYEGWKLEELKQLGKVLGLSVSDDMNNMCKSLIDYFNRTVKDKKELKYDHPLIYKHILPENI